MQGYFDVLQGLSREDLKDIKFHNGELEGSAEVENALEAIADKAGITTDQIEILFAALEAGGVLKTEASEAALQRVNQLLINGIDELHKLQEEGIISIDFDVDTDMALMSVEELEDYIDDIEEEKKNIQIKLDTVIE